MEATGKIKRARTVSETAEFNNSSDTDSRLDIVASVNIDNGRFSHIQSATIRERGSEDSSTVATFNSPNDSQLDMHFYRRIDGMSRADILNAAEAFIADLKEAIQND